MRPAIEADAPTVKRAPPAGAAEAGNIGAGKRAEREAGDAAGRVDDDHPARTVEIRGDGRELPHRHHVEQDVQHAGVQPRRAEHGPPSAEPEDGDRAALAEEEERARADGPRNENMPPWLMLPRDAISVST